MVFGNSTTAFDEEAEFEDGWDDDGLLEDISNEGLGDDNDDDDDGGGWDDDDDLNFDDDWGDDDGDNGDDGEVPVAASNPSSASAAAAAPAPTPTSNSSIPVVPNPPPIPSHPEPPSYQQQQQQQQQHPTASSNTNNFGDNQDVVDHDDDADGWDDDDDLNFDDDGWGDDDGGDGDDDQGETDDVVVGNDNNGEDTAATSNNINNSTMTNMTSQPTNPPPPKQIQSRVHGRNHPNEYKIRNLHQELEKYVSSLGHMSSSINAVLEYEYNTPQKAQELIEYYTNRPALAEYTRSKELPRMDYQVVLPYGQGVETDKSQILAMGLLPDESLVARASNQSLLADLLQVLTGHDMVVRPQYLAICVAKYCKFTIHLEDYENIVDCQARLYLSLPTTETQQRLDVAEMFVSVVFAPDQGTVQYRVQTINVLLNDIERLQHAAQFLAEMDLVGDDDYSSPYAAQPADSFRDAFLENSQKFFTQSTDGFSQALQQMDSVINIKSKLNTISKFIPDTDVIAAAEQEAIELAQARQQEVAQQQQQHDQYRQSNMTVPVPPLPVPHQGAQFPRPPPPPPPPQPPAHQDIHLPPNQKHGGVVDDASRPKSILGGFFKTLASSVTLPDENPALYGQPDHPEFNRNPSTDQNNEMPMLYRRDDKTPPSQPRNISTLKQVHESFPHITNTAEAQVHVSCNDDHHRAKFLIDEHQNNEHPSENETHFRASPYTAPDGWDDGINDDAIDLDLSAAATTSAERSPSKEVGPDAPFTHKSSPNRDIEDETNVIVRDTDKRPKPVAEKPHHNKDDHVVETRKRWINPRPHRPYIIALE